jgi:hypothetical protein
MSRFRSLGFALWLALALFMGQQVAVLHDLGHASEQLGQKSDTKVPKPCNEHFACSQLANAVGSNPPTVPQVSSADVRSASSLDQGTSTPARLAYRSRAPPASSV